MLKTALRHGAIAGAIISVVLLLPQLLVSYEGLEAAEVTTTMRRSELIGYGTMVLAMALVYFAIREQRARHEGAFGFGAAFATGLATTLVAAAVLGVATSLFYLGLGPERTDEFMRLYVGTTLGPDPAPEALAAAMAEYEAQKGLWLNPLFQGFVMFATVAPIGLLLSGLAGWLLRRPEE